MMCFFKDMAQVKLNSTTLSYYPAGTLVHPRQNGEVSDWLDGVLASGATVYIPEIIDYELRRALIFGGLTRSIQRLDELEAVLPFLPLDRATMLDAAELWAQARRQGKSVADPKELDGDAKGRRKRGESERLLSPKTSGIYRFGWKRAIGAK